MKNIVSRYLVLISVSLIIFLTTSCQKEKEPGPISVSNIITPSAMSSGGSINWTIEVENLGGEVEIERVHVREEFISGWAQGQGTVETDLPISNITIPEGKTKTIYSISTPVYNTGSDDVTAKNTVTVYSTGGVATDAATILILKGSSSINNNNTVKSLTLKSFSENNK